MLNVATKPEIDALIAAGAPVAVGVSGGKDSQAAALATFEQLDRVGHIGPRVLIHSDLGRTEWGESLPVCERLAAHLGCELIVVRRKAGDMLDRWLTRWDSSVRRYENLETVTLVLPWSTPSMRFCTSELKTHIISAELRRRFRGQMIVNVTGVRREESTQRAKGSIASLDSDGKAWSWRPISDWTEAQVFERIARSGLAPHVAYSRGLSRVSCMFCIMQNTADQIAAAAIEESHSLYRCLVALEIRSTFGFQGSRWLADVAPHLLTDMQRINVVISKDKAATRIALEKTITKEMLYVKGWPTRMLTDAEAVTLANVLRGRQTNQHRHADRDSASSGVLHAVHGYRIRVDALGVDAVSGKGQAEGGRMKAYLITMLSLHILCLLTIVYRLGTDGYPRVSETTRAEAAFISFPICVAFLAWEAWLLFGGSL